MRDLIRLREAPEGVSASPEEDNILKWNALIIGPPDTPFEDGTFKLILQFTEKYPNEPPKVKFQTNMFHPNIYADGQLCLDILARKWSPTFDVLSILISVQSLLGKNELQRVPSFACILVLIHSYPILDKIPRPFH